MPAHTAGGGDCVARRQTLGRETRRTNGDRCVARRLGHRHRRQRPILSALLHSVDPATRAVGGPVVPTPVGGNRCATHLAPETIDALELAGVHARRVLVRALARVGFAARTKRGGTLRAWSLVA